MNTGQVISGLGHIGLIGWAFLGAFKAEPLPFDVTAVSVISGAEFDALYAPQSQPETVTQVAMPPEPATEIEAVAPTVEDTLPATEAPETVAEPDPEILPEVQPVVPTPAPDLADSDPVIPNQDFAVAAPDLSTRPVPRPSERVAPEPVAIPEPDARPDPVEQEAVTPDESTEVETTAEETEATAPEEATTEIVTEAEEPSGTMTTSLRPPRSRPAPPVRQAEEAPTATDNADVLAALQSAEVAQSDTQPSAAPAGPPMSAGEKDTLRVAVSSCWNVGSLSSDALNTTVVVGVAMDEAARPVTASIRMLSFSGGTEAAARQAYEAARRAIIRCGAKGYELPPEKYAHWKDIEMTFNPERMRIK
ncbi:MAG: energy transducer TonB [Pseudomonadota bacterium]